MTIFRPQVAVRVGRGVLSPLLWLCFLVLAPGLGISSLSAQSTRQPLAIPVSASGVKRTDVQTYLLGTGTVKPFNSVTIRSLVDGQIDKIYFAEGQFVHQGDTLAEIDPTSYQAALQLVQAAKAKDESLLANAKRDLSRFSHLTEGGWSTGQQLDTTKSLVEQLEATVKADQAQVRLAELQLLHCTIKAPFDGRIGTRIVDAGNIVRATEATGLVTLNQVQPISVEFSVPAEALEQLRAANKLGEIAVEVMDTSGKPLGTGKLVAIDNQINVSTASIRLKADFANLDEKLWPGLFVTTRLPLITYKSVITTPIEAIQRSNAGPFVYIVGANKTIEKRSVTLGYTNKTTAIVMAGLKDNEVVVTEGQYRIQAGSIVETALDPDTTMH